MKRETMIAVGLGIFLGICVGLVMLFQTNNTQETKVVPMESSNDNEVVQNRPAEDATFLSLSEPLDQSIYNTDEITIKGSAQSNSLIVVQSPSSHKVVKNENKDFSIEFPLALGENMIHIRAYVGSGTPQEQTLKVYYVEE